MHCTAARGEPNDTKIFTKARRPSQSPRFLMIPATAQKSKDKVNAAANSGARAQDRVTREVRHELVMLPLLLRSITQPVSDRSKSPVTLMGQVTRPRSRATPGNVVKGIEGVWSTSDEQIQVLPLSSIGRWLCASPGNWAIYGHTGLDRYALQSVPPIHIIVDNGKVTLEEHRTPIKAMRHGEELVFRHQQSAGSRQRDNENLGLLYFAPSLAEYPGRVCVL